MSKQDCQITMLDHEGTPTLYHPETNADQVVTGETYRVPEISQITNWENRSSELINARKGETSLRNKIDKIDKALMSQNLLSSIKEVDGEGCELDSDKVDGKDVNDDAIDSSSLWTARKIITELDKKVDDASITVVAEPHKILALNEDSKLEADVQGNADTATRFHSPVNITFNHSVKGNLSLMGDEGAIHVDLQIMDDSHKHSKISNGINSIEAGKSNNIVEFKKNEEVLSLIDEHGNFTGSAKKLDGLSVSDEQDTGVLWTSDKITKELTRLKEEFQEGVEINQELQTISFGALKIKYGSIALGAARTQTTVSFEEPFTTVLFTNHSLETTDVSLSCVRLTGDTTKGLEFLLNKPALNGNINWFVVGI